MIEADRVSPSVSALRLVLAALDIGFADFFAGSRSVRGEQIVYRAGELIEIAGGAVSYRQVGSEPRRPSRCR